MSPLDSKLRLAIYVLLAIFGTVLATIDLVDFADAKAVVKFVIGIMVSGFTTLRAYIDKSPAQVVEAPKPKETPP